MMSVFIKGMTMPKSCYECKLKNNRHTSCGIISDCFVCGSVIGFGTDNYVNNRHPDCPLVELPEKHGDLIDRDALIKDLTNGIKAGFLLNGYEEYPNINNMDDCVECVKYADVVIEAEIER